MSNEKYWECQYCLKRYKRESAFLKHECSEMKKNSKMSTNEGQASYSYYCSWLREQNRKAPTIDTFMTSRYFNAFGKFADFVKKYKIPEPDKFIHLMVKNGNMSPMLWCRDECYTIYLEWYDKTTTPIDQAEKTVKHLYNLVEIKGVKDVPEVLESMHYRELVEQIRLRKISPWVLLCSKKFKAILANIPADERIYIANVIGVTYYAEKFEKNPEIVKQMKQIAEAMNI